ncbi:MULTISPECIES: hypothetical protein [Priestia]|uniref:hypothetical protein n=1 Tax=Priestia TaxID=2800373 RepID=UPI00167734F6|nr:hypothetical protein [Priestia megaterium]MBU8853474.1 hypothetical protein [Bacillus sp. FJAT-26377]
MRKFCIALFSLFFSIGLVGCQSKDKDPLEFSGEKIPHTHPYQVFFQFAILIIR